MNKHIVPILSASCISFAAVAQGTWTPAEGRYQATANYAEKGSGFYENWIEGKLSLGLTVSTYSLTDGKRPANRQDDFLGNINELKESHPNRLLPTLEYQACDYLCVGLSYMHVEASTLNFNNGEGDGNAVMKGPVFTAEATYPFWEKRLYPHVGVGVAFLAGDFEEDTWWHLGYSSPDSWASLGSPKKELRGNHYRYIDVDDETPVFFTIGLSCRPHPRVKLDISYRRISIDPDCEFGYNYVGPKLNGKDKHSDGDFDLSGEFWLFSASYVF
ncbi:MAG: hypothetical protein ILM98_07435 [Kiritimatiellae bacterium]|nr:hypothetical protein [Kiritimatiellia bacterium]